MGKEVLKRRTELIKGKPKQARLVNFVNIASKLLVVPDESRLACKQNSWQCFEQQLCFTIINACMKFSVQCEDNSLVSSLIVKSLTHGIKSLI